MKTNSTKRIAPVYVDWQLLFMKLRSKGITIKEIAIQVDMKPHALYGYKNRDIERPYYKGAKILNLASVFLNVEDFRQCGVVV